MKKYQAPTRKSSSSSLLKRIGIAALITGVVVGGLALLDARNVIDLPLFKDAQPTSTSEGINYGPPTEQEVQETEDYKDNLGNGTPTPSTSGSSGSKKSVSPVVSSWGYADNMAQVSGYVSGVIEDGGNCTLTLKKDGQVVAESKSAAADAQTTSCGLLSVDRSRLSAGSWTATLSYESSTSQGTSQSVTIEVN